MTPVLHVWANGIHAATVSVGDDRTLALSYTRAWQEWPDAYPFSPHLPFGKEAAAGEVRNFLENLLPEGQALDQAASTHQLSKYDSLGLLARIGREVAGALSILPVTEAPATEELLRPLPLAELSARIRARPEIPFSVWDARFRVSVAGFQDKLAVHLQEDRVLALPDGAGSSTHLVKPESVNPKLPCLPANEYFCLRLAAHLGLAVPEVALWHIPEPLLVIERFDRVRAGGATQRRHQLDLCQVLNLPPAQKFERAYEFAPRGAQLTDLFKAAQFTTAPAPTRAQLLRWVVAGYLLGNTDAHAKNISFLLDKTGLTLAPFYDIACGTVYGTKDLALFIGDEEEIALVGANDWLAFAEACGLRPQLVATELVRAAERWAAPSARSLRDDNTFDDRERAFIEQLVRDMDARATLLPEQAAAVRRHAKRP